MTSSVRVAIELKRGVGKLELDLKSYYYCFLLARYHIWLAKTKENHPNLTHFIYTLKSQYEIEIKSGETKKWKPLAGYMKIELIT